MRALVLIAVLAACAGSTPAVSVTVDDAFHSPSDTVRIQVCACWIPKNYTDHVLSVSVDGPDGHNELFRDLRFDQLPVMITWHIPENAAEGTYTVTVTWDHRYVQTGIVVTGQPIPEYPFTSVVLLVVVAIATLAMAWRKASARTETSAANS